MKSIIYLFTACVLFSSCGIQMKINAAKEQANYARAEVIKERSSIIALAALAQRSFQMRKIDSSILQKIDNILRRFSDSSSKDFRNIELIDSLVAHRQLFKKNYEKVVQPALGDIAVRGERFGGRMNSYIMIDDVLNVTEFKLFELAAFFGPGVYTIPQDKLEMTKNAFLPVVDSVIFFSNRYKNISRTATLVVQGFADGTGISGGPLYDTLALLINSPAPSKEDLNKMLSELRAKALIPQLDDLFASRKPVINNLELLKLEYVAQGKGEQYPLPNIKDYTTDDARRRIVLCYWIVLPN